MDDMVGGVYYLIVRGLLWFVMNVLFKTVCWSVGWITLKILTLGRCPKQHSNEEKVARLGFFILTFQVVGIALYYLIGRL